MNNLNDNTPVKWKDLKENAEYAKQYVERKVAESASDTDSKLDEVRSDIVLLKQDKADQTEVDEVKTELAGKAGSEALAETKTDVEVLKSRVNEITNLPEGSTAGDAELTDIRVGADGKTYANAGEAVRGQITSLKETITTTEILHSFFKDEIEKEISLHYEQGYMTLDDPDIPSTVYVRNSDYIDKEIAIYNPEGYRVYAMLYKSDDLTIPYKYYDFDTNKASSSSTHSTNTVLKLIPPADMLARIRFRRDEEKPLSVTDSTIRTYTVDKTLSGNSKKFTNLARASLISAEAKGTKYVVINDAAELSPILITADSIIHSRNFFKINSQSRENNGITFEKSETDENACVINGTSTGNAYSYGTITTGNALIKNFVGTLYIFAYSENPLVRTYLNIFDVETGEASTKSDKANKLRTYEFSRPSNIGIRVQVPPNCICENDRVEVYASIVPPDKYVPYSEPNDAMKEYSIVENESDKLIEVEYFKKNSKEKHTKITVGTFNVGDYSANGGYPGEDVNEPAGDLQSYARYISSLNADVLCTQEDREYWNVSEKVTMKSVLYDYMYNTGRVVSKAVSHGNIWAKGIFSNYEIIKDGRYTFETQGINLDTGNKFWNSFTYAILKINNEEILFISVHLAPKSNNVAARKAQIEEMMSFVSGYNKFVICGDMNVWEDELDGFSGCSLANGGLYGLYDTYYGSTFHPYDNIITSSDIKITNVKVHINDEFKDHYAVTCDIII